MAHHTKDKGDIAVAKTAADIVEKGGQVAFLLSEHLPFDLIAISECGSILRRIQVKFRTKNTWGTVIVKLSSNWSDKNGVHNVPYDTSKFDVIAIYCPDSDEVYYIRSEELNNSSNFAIRIEECKNNQTSGIRYGKDYVDFNRILP